MGEVLSHRVSHDKVIAVAKGDITGERVDAIVNAANTHLVLGSGVAGAIRRIGGEGIQAECSSKAPIPLGEAAVTGAGSLKAEYVIHAAGMHLGGRVTEESLRASTENSLKRADELGLRSVAFPAIGTGVGGFPVDRCAGVMMDTVEHYLSNERTTIDEVRFVLFDERSFNVFARRLESLDE